MKIFLPSCTPVLVLLLLVTEVDAFAPTKATFQLSRPSMPWSPSSSSSSSSSLKMGLDLVTYLRTEWVSAALCTNQTPRTADVCLQLGTQDGRAITFIPKTIRELITSTAEKDGKLTVTTRRQLKQQQERRRAATVTYSDQPSDNLFETPDESVDVVISLQAAARMMENGLDWKKSIREAARVLKPGGRLLFVEQTDLDGESYVQYIADLVTLDGKLQAAEDDDEEDENKKERFPIFDEGGVDEVDLVLVPHVAGVAIKAMDAGLTPIEREKQQAAKEKERLADLSLEAYERGLKKRKRRKKKKAKEEEESKASLQ